MGDGASAGVFGAMFGFRDNFFAILFCVLLLALGALRVTMSSNVGGGDSIGVSVFEIRVFPNSAGVRVFPNSAGVRLFANFFGRLRKDPDFSPAGTITGTSTTGTVTGTVTGTSLTTGTVTGSLTTGAFAAAGTVTGS